MALPLCGPATQHLQLLAGTACGSSCCAFACRYGPDARQAAGDVSTAAIEGSAAYYNMTRMGVRTVAKRIAKRTAKGLVKNTVLTGRAGMGIFVVVNITSSVAQGLTVIGDC